MFPPDAPLQLLRFDPEPREAAFFSVPLSTPAPALCGPLAPCSCSPELAPEDSSEQQTHRSEHRSAEHDIRQCPLDTSDEGGVQRMKNADDQAGPGREAYRPIARDHAEGESEGDPANQGACRSEDNHARKRAVRDTPLPDPDLRVLLQHDAKQQTRADRGRCNVKNIPT